MSEISISTFTESANSFDPLVTAMQIITSDPSVPIRALSLKSISTPVRILLHSRFNKYWVNILHNQYFKKPSLSKTEQKLILVVGLAKTRTYDRHYLILISSLDGQQLKRRFLQQETPQMIQKVQLHYHLWS